jgi:hypothetical protein
MKRKYFLLTVFLFLLLNVFVFRNVIFSHQRLLSFNPTSDTFNYFGMSKFLESQSLCHGLMLWNPYLFCGYPWIANSLNQIFYPLNSLFLFLPFHLAINYSFILHIFLMGVFMFLMVSYLKSDWYIATLSGLIFMFSGPVFLYCFYGRLFSINTFLWLPLIFLLLEMCLRKGKLIYAVFAGLALATQILAGEPQYVYYTLLAVFLYFLFTIISGSAWHDRKRKYGFVFGALAIFLAVGMGVTALRLVPILEFSSLSNRSIPDYKMVAFSSFPPQNLITYIFPEFFGDVVHFPYWGGGWDVSGYVGILPLILSLIAFFYQRNKYTLFFGCLSIFALLGSLGEHTPLFKLFYYTLPGFNKFRAHSRFLILFVFSVAILSAYGLSWLVERREDRRDSLRKIVLALGIISGSLAFVALLASLNYQPLLRGWMQIWESKGLPLEMGGTTLASAMACTMQSIIKGIFFFTAVFFLLFFWMKKRISVKIFKIAIAVLITADLLSFGAKLIVWDNVKKCFWDERLVSFLKSSSGSRPYRVFYFSILNGNVPSNNKGVLDGISIINGYGPLVIRRYDNFLGLCFSESIDSPHRLKLLSMINLKYLILPPRIKLTNPAYHIVYKTDNETIWENGLCFPRSYIVHAAEFAKDDETALKMVFDDGFDPIRTVVLKKNMTTGASLKNPIQPDQEKAFILKYEPNKVTVQAKLKDDGYLVLSDVNYPGWTANILDIKTGKTETAEVLDANYIFRAVSLKKGDYMVSFIFHPRSFYFGVLISLAALVIVIIVLIFMRHHKRLSSRKISKI